MPIQIVGRPLGNMVGGKLAYKANAAVLRHEKLLLKAKELKVGTIKNLKTMSPDAYRRILQKINADIAKQNVNGVIASRIYQNLMGFVNRGVQNITQSVITNTSSQAIVSAATQIGRGTSFLANANSLGAAKAQISAVARQQAKNVAKQATKELQREAYKGVNKVFSIYDITDTTIPVEFIPDELKDKLVKKDSTLMLVTFDKGTSDEETIEAVRELRIVSKDSAKVSGMTAMVVDTMELSDQEITAYVLIAVVLCLIVLIFATDSYMVPIFLLGNIGMAILYNLG